MMQNSYTQRKIIFKQLCEEKFHGFIEKFLQRVKDTPIDQLKMAKIIDDIEVESIGKIAKVALGIRIGPMLGLMGTLIPLGPGLVALAEGDISRLANYLTIAFTTTIIGLLIGALSYITAQIRRKWYAQDLNDLKFIYEYYFWKGEGK
jgi:biopolymer transport protein ExbB/TolQ